MERISDTLPGKADGTQWRNRIVGEGMEAPDQLLANPQNWRVHPKFQQDVLSSVLRDVGWIQEVIVNKTTGHLVDGHLRVTLAMRHEEKEIPVKYVELTSDEEALILATLDPLAGLAVADDEKLRELMAEIKSDDAAIQAMMDAIKADVGILEEEERPDDPGAQIDKAEELREKWGVETGQLWQLGDHRLICGDCTDGDVVARVTGGEKADCSVTDPPYGVGIDYESFDDTQENVKRLIDLVMPILLQHKPVALTPGVPAMWDYPRPSWVGAWVHPASTSSGAWGFVGANPILYYGKDPYLSAGKGRRDSSLVLVSDRKGEDDHPVSKPLNVWEWLVERVTSEQGLIVFDPFVGSGTTLIACERLNRKCRAVEISPAYCAVTIERWARMTGGVPELIDND